MCTCKFICVISQGIATDLVVQVVLIAESMRLQAMMGTYGIQTQTPHEVEPVQVSAYRYFISWKKNLKTNGSTFV